MRDQKISWEMKFLLIALMFQQGSACNVIYKMTTLQGCEKDFAPTIAPLNSSTVTYGTECLLLCRNNINCNGISICPDSEDPGLFSCSVFTSATDGTCGSLTSAGGCRYLEFEIVPNGPQCVPPRVFDEKRDKCVCDPVWMTGPNCEQYYIDCSHAYADGLRSDAHFNILVMPIKPRISVAPFHVNCSLIHGGSTVIQRRELSCPEGFSGRGWDDFRDGFGDYNCAFFLGLEKMFQILQNGRFRLQVQMKFSTGLNEYAHYYEFNMTDESTHYTVDWDRYSPGNIYESEDGLGYGGSTFQVKGSRFATHDNDFNGCAQAQGTGWWYNEDCSLVNLNLPLNTPAPLGAAWPRNGSLHTFTFVKVALKRVG